MIVKIITDNLDLIFFFEHWIKGFCLFLIICVKSWIVVLSMAFVAGRRGESWFVELIHV